MRDLTHLSLFSGIGGLDLAAEWAGRWQSCGMFNKAWDKHPVIREVVQERKQKEADNAPLDGQISLEV